MKTRVGTREGVQMEERRWTGPCRGHPSLARSGETRSCCQQEEETKGACSPDECPGVIVTWGGAARGPRGQSLAPGGTK